MCQTQADWLSPKRFDAWLRGQGYCGRKSGQQLHDHLTTAPRGIEGVEGDARGLVTRTLLAAIDHLNSRIATLERQIHEQLELHPDAHIFTSLPKSGIVRAATLLAEIGDARGRLPTDDALAALAGARHPPDGPANSTRSRSGSHATRSYATRSSTSPTTADTPHLGRRHLHTRPSPQPAPPHAVRILARAWIRVIWRCWQDGVAYDPDKHGGHQKLLMTAAA